MNFEKILDAIGDAILLYTVPLLAVLVGLFVARIILRKALAIAKDTLVKQAEKKAELPGEALKRLNTLFGIVEKTSFFILYFIAILVFLSTISVNIAPILAAAGVLGLAVSFGSQELVKDIISGTFLLIENQIRVGDVVTINGTGGLVEDIRLRTVVLRDLHGVVHVIRNGNIDMTSNMTKNWSGAVLDIGVAYKEDVDRVIGIMREVSEEMRKDETFGPKIINDIEIFGVDSFGDSSVNIRMRLKTKPIEQWNIAREYRRRIKYAFDKNSIEIPFPHRSIYFGSASDPIKLLMEKMGQQEEEKESPKGPKEKTASQRVPDNDDDGEPTNDER